MKAYLILFLLFIFQGAVGQDFRAAFVSSNDKGDVTIDIWNVKKGKNYNLETARKESVLAILLSNIGSDGRNPSITPLLNNEESRKLFSKMQKKFFSKNGDYSRFIISTDFINSTLPEIAGPKNWKIFRVCVSKNELRKHLEEKEVLKKLNNLF
jgi:hypothetical protein